MNTFVAISALSLALLASCAADEEKNRSPTTRPVVLLELFTSEGCSSCPPADALLAELSKPDALPGVTIIPLALHVDYWNRLGWTDSYSQAKFSERQERYAARFGRDQVYTPQMVVDGVTQFVGSNRGAAVEAIASAAKQPKGLISLRPSITSKSLKVDIVVASIPAISRGDTAQVLLAVTEDDLSSDVTRGENAGRKLPHTAVVRDVQVVGVIDPGMAPRRFDRRTELKVKEAWQRQKLKVIVFVQERYSGRMLAAATAPVPKE